MYYLADVRYGFLKYDYIELIKAETKEDAYKIVWKRHPKAKRIEISDTLE